MKVGYAAAVIRKAMLYSYRQVIKCLMDVQTSLPLSLIRLITLPAYYLNLRFLAASDFFLRFTLGLS